MSQNTAACDTHTTHTPSSGAPPALGLSGFFWVEDNVAEHRRLRHYRQARHLRPEHTHMLQNMLRGLGFKGTRARCCRIPPPATVSPGAPPAPSAHPYVAKAFRALEFRAYQQRPSNLCDLFWKFVMLCHVVKRVCSAGLQKNSLSPLSQLSRGGQEG